FHNSRYLMSQCYWHLSHCRASRPVMSIRVTDSGSTYAHENILLPNLWNGYFLQLQWLTCFHHADRFHTFSSNVGSTSWSTLHKIPCPPRNQPNIFGRGAAAAANQARASIVPVPGLLAKRSRERFIVPIHFICVIRFTGIGIRKQRFV